MPKGKKRRHKLVKLRQRMEERGESALSLSRKTDTVSPGRIVRLADPTDDPFSQAHDHEAIELANALACYPEQLTGTKPFAMFPKKHITNCMRLEEDRFGNYPEYGWR